MKVPFLDLKLINSKYKNDLMKSYDQFIDSGWYIMGSTLKQFEAQFAEYIGAKHCVGVANGLDALNLILRAYKELGKLKEGDEVAVPANTYIATILAIMENGLKPVLIEPDLKTYNIDPRELEKNISPKLKAVMVVHLYGMSCPMNEIAAICKKNNLFLFEDCAQSQGARIDGKITGAFGDAAGFSFYPGKNLGALGDAGAVTTIHDDVAETIRYIRNYGSKVKYHNEYIGVNSRLDELQAGVLSLKLPKLDSENELRRQIAKKYLSEIKNSKVTLPETSNDEKNVWHLFVVRTKSRDQFQAFLRENDVETLIHYPIPPHKQKALKAFNQLSLPVTELIHEEVVSLPIYPYMPMEHVEKVIKTINSY